MVIPCEDCLLVPACKHKPYMNLMDECVNLRGAIYKDGYGGRRLTISRRRDVSDKALLKVHEILNPPNWILEYTRERLRYKIVHLKSSTKKEP